MTEALFYQGLKDNLPNVYCQRIESTTGSGIFDVNMLSNGKEIWCELKIGAPVLRRFQYSWGMERAHHGGLCYVLSWNEGGIVKIWRFPQLELRPIGKNHLAITNEQLKSISLTDKKNLYKFLFD